MRFWSWCESFAIVLFHHLIRFRRSPAALHLLVSSQAFIRSSDFLAEAEAAAALSHLFSLPSNLVELVLLANRDDATVLHICLAVGAHERVILKVLDAAPEAARRKDHFGYIPLHYVAAFGGTPWPVVAKLIETFPESIRATTSDGDTPLHLLMSNGAKFLREQSRNADGSAAFLDRNTTKLAELLMGEQGDIIENIENNGLEKEETSEHIPPLLMVNQSELTPLHVSACFDAPPQLIKILMESAHGPNAVMTTTSLGYTPLHLACAGIRKHKAGKSKSSKRLLASVEALATPDACAARDSLGRTPLMLAAQNKKADKHVIRALIRVNPSAVEHRTANGYLPLHLAVQSKYASESVVKTLITEYPKSVYEKSHKGETVLHVACLVSKIPYDVVDLLVRKNPGAVDCANASHELPIDRARAMGASKKVVALLLETASKNLRRKDSPKVKISSKASAASRPSTASSSTDANAKSVGFFAPQVREPSSRSRSAAPDPPTESPAANSRPTDPTPIRRRGRTPEPSQSLLTPPDQQPVATTSSVPTRHVAEKQRSVVLVEPVNSASRESRSRDRTAFTGRRAMSVSQDIQSVHSISGSSDLKRRARTRSPARTPHDASATRKPVLERRAKSDANLQPRIARKRVTRLSKGESTSAITKGDVYRFEI
jgi:ankyrin repeat protein